MKSIIISDLHLGIDNRIAENVKNRPLLISFLEKQRREERPDEIVINGDFLDQWFLPATYEHVTDSDEFYKKCADNNKGVIDAFKSVIKDGIDLIYVPGNHDMTLKHEVLSEIIPGIRQIRDARGLGRYRTGERGEVVIEHCHRYESFCAPNPLSNKKYVKYGEPILPPGYFFALVGVQSFMERQPKSDKAFEDAPLPDMNDVSKVNSYAYYKVWRDILEDIFPVNESVDDKFIKVNVDGFQGEFSINDLLPKMTEEGLKANLYSDFVESWDEIQRRNMVSSPVDLTEQLKRMTDQTLRCEYAKKQYLDLDPTIDVVVFGHTHVPFYKTFRDEYDKDKIYVNEGTWVDNNSDDPDNTATFAEITSRSSETKVELLKCIGDGKVEDIVKASNKYTE